MSSFLELSSDSLVSDAMADRLDGRLLPTNELQNNVTTEKEYIFVLRKLCLYMSMFYATEGKF